LVSSRAPIELREKGKDGDLKKPSLALVTTQQLMAVDIFFPSGKDVLGQASLEKADTQVT